MTRTTLKKMISQEINHINKEIDQRIIDGMVYTRQAAKHRALMMQYNRLLESKRMNVSVGSLLGA